MITAGREAGKYCVFVKAIDNSFAEITGPKEVTGVKRRKINLLHIEPTDQILEISSGEDMDVEAAWKGSSASKKFGLKAPRKRAVKAK